MDHRQIVRFVFVGGTCTLFQYVLLTALIELAGMPAVAASALSYAIAVLLNYELSRRITFQAGDATLKSLTRFILTSLIGLTANTLLFRGALAAGVPHYLIAQMIATAVVTVLNFNLYKHWSFRDRP